jgi:RNA polymerase sigma-70 factor (subfamily 1)
MANAPPPGDPPRIEHLLQANLTGLRAFLRLRTGAALRARLEQSDLVQSVCREVLEGAAAFDFRGDAAFRNWLYTAALRKIVEHDRHMHAARRDARREHAIDADGGADAAVLQGYAAATTPSLLAMGREGAEKLEAAFDELDEQHREIITMARLCGLSHAEIGERLGITTEASRQLLRRALVKLSVALHQRGVVI